MEDELHELLRNALGGTWDSVAQEIWNAFEKRTEERVQMLEGANEGWRRQFAAIPPLTTCAECADTISITNARHGPGGYCWCEKCFEGIECDDPGCHGHASHPCEECGRQWGHIKIPTAQVPTCIKCGYVGCSCNGEVFKGPE